MSFLVLTHDEVERLLPMRECVDVMEDALGALALGHMHLPLRMVVRPPGEDSFLGLMPTHRSQPDAVYALKVIVVAPDNPQRGLDAHQGAVMLFDGETGEVRAVMNASAITAIRTAAVSGVATRHLARADARRLAILGSGVQAKAHLEAMRCVRDFDEVRVYSPNREHAASLGVDVAGSAEEAVRDADVVVTATTAREPVLFREWLKPGAHVNAVGACFPTTRELDGDLVAASVFVVDRRESAENEAGDYVLALDEGKIKRGHIHGELGDVLIGTAPGRRNDEEITVFESLGLAIEDLAAAQHVLRKAEEQGVGTRVEF
jgi:ornithine cyclodeaminase